MKDYIYKYRNAKFAEFRQVSYKSAKKLIANEYNEAVIVPFEFNFRNNEQSSHLGGVIDKNNQYIPESAFYRWCVPSPNDNFVIEENYQNAKEINEVVIYGGYFYSHWGHFLMEMSGRLWYYLQKAQNQKIKLALAVKKNVRLENNFKEFFDLLGIKQSDIIYVEEPTRFKKVIVPENSTIITKYYTDEFMLPFRMIYQKVKPSNINKVYFTRQSLPEKQGLTIGEKNIERYFRKNGFKILAPEKLSLSKMVSILKGAEYIAGLVGTLTHNFIFANPKAKIILLNREEYLNPSQEMICQELQQDVCYIDVFLNFLPVRPGTGPYLVGITDNLANYFQDNGMFVEKTQNEPTPKQINIFLKAWAKAYDSKRNDTFMMEKKVSDWMDLVINMYKN